MRNGPSRLDTHMDFSNLTRELFRTYQAQEEQVFGRYGVAVAEGRVLLALLEPGPSKATDLAGSLGCTKSRLSPLIERLAQKGLINRRESESDRRIRTLTLTLEGERIARAVREFEDHVHDELLAAFKGAEREQLVEALGRLNRVMHELRDKLRDSSAGRAYNYTAMHSGVLSD